MKTSEQILEIAQQIESVLKEHDYPAPNMTAVARLRFLAGQLSGTDLYASGHAARIAELAGHFYSERRHKKYPGGADAIYGDMRHDLLDRIRSQASVRKARDD